MSGLGYRQASNTQGACKRIPRPFDQADTDGELVEHGCAANVPFFIPAHPLVAPSNSGQAASVSANASDATGRYGDVALSSIGEDSERERDA